MSSASALIFKLEMLIITKASRHSASLGTWETHCWFHCGQAQRFAVLARKPSSPWLWCHLEMADGITTLVLSLGQNSSCGMHFLLSLKSHFICFPCWLHALIKLVVIFCSFWPLISCYILKTTVHSLFMLFCILSKDHCMFCLCRTSLQTRWSQ